MRCFVLLLLAMTACSSSSGGSSASTPCNQDPWECPSAQTCWPESVDAFACLNAGPGALGDPCENTVTTPTCGAGLACFQSVGSSSTMGSCVAYCSTTDPSHACPSGDLCETAVLGGAGGPEFSICVSPSSGEDAGSSQGDGAAGDAPSGG
ncbi:MAG TPA: hypothetical protein VGL81_04055 [Polyangiaceae bacterium]|jgi:hypothetical protein